MYPHLPTTRGKMAAHLKKSTTCKHKNCDHEQEMGLCTVIASSPCQKCLAMGKLCVMRVDEGEETGPCDNCIYEPDLEAANSCNAMCMEDREMEGGFLTVGGGAPDNFSDDFKNEDEPMEGRSTHLESASLTNTHGDAKSHKLNLESGKHIFLPERNSTNSNEESFDSTAEPENPDAEDVTPHASALLGTLASENRTLKSEEVGLLEANLELAGRIANLTTDKIRLKTHLAITKENIARMKDDDALTAGDFELSTRLINASVQIIGEEASGLKKSNMELRKKLVEAEVEEHSLVEQHSLALQQNHTLREQLATANVNYAGMAQWLAHRNEGIDTSELNVALERQLLNAVEQIRSEGGGFGRQGEEIDEGMSGR